MEYAIVTNNPIVMEKFDDTIPVDGSFIDVLYKTRDLVHRGHKLISFPLFASIRMMYSPSRSLLISKEKGSIDEDSVEIIEGSIDKYILTMGERKPDIRNKKDYEIIDCDLIISAMEEVRFINAEINK